MTECPVCLYEICEACGSCHNCMMEDVEEKKE